MRRDTDKGQEKEKPSRTVFLAMFPLKQLLHAKVRACHACAVVFVRVRSTRGLIGRAARQGINLRNLGRVRHMVGQLVPPNSPGLADTRQLLFLEMCARTIRYFNATRVCARVRLVTTRHDQRDTWYRKIVFAKLRQRMKKLRVPLEEPYREVYLHYLNKLFVPLADRDVRNTTRVDFTAPSWLIAVRAVAHVSCACACACAAPDSIF
jgi:hypothetical protein